MHRNRHPSSKCTGILPLTHECTANGHSSGKCPGILPLTHECTANHHFSCECTDIQPQTHECTEIIIPQVNAPESYPSHMNVSKSSPLRKKDRYLTPHTWMHRNHHPLSKCTGILPLTLEWSEIVTPQVNHRNPTPHTWMHRNHHPSSECTGILPLTHECTANRHSSGKCTNILCTYILPLIHENTEIIIPQVDAKEFPLQKNAPNRHPSDAPESHPSHMNAPKIVTPQVNAPISYPSHMNAPRSSSLK